MIGSIPIYAVLARDSNNHIGSNGSLPWKDDSLTRWDMLNFKKLTTGNIIYMGYNTALTFQNPLPDRINVIEDRLSVSSDSLEISTNSFFKVKSLENFINDFQEKFETDWKNKKIFLIGGAKLLKKYSAIIDELYLTTFSNNYNGDVFFDEGILSKFSKSEKIEIHKNGMIERFSNLIEA